MTTVGSFAIRGIRVAMQTAGANARDRLRAAAAKSWGVPHSQILAELGRVHDTGGTRSATYCELAAAAAAVTEVPEGSEREWCLLRFRAESERELE